MAELAGQFVKWRSWLGECCFLVAEAPTDASAGLRPLEQEFMLAEQISSLQPPWLREDGGRA